MKKLILEIILTITRCALLILIAYYLHLLNFTNEQVMATLISLFSIGVAARALQVQRNDFQRSVEHDIRSVTPYLQSWTYLEHADDYIQVTLRNCGIGPACIQKITLDGSYNTYQRVWGIVSSQLKDNVKADKLVKGVTSLNDCLLPANDELSLFRIDFDNVSDFDRLKILERVSKLKIHVDFLDIYELDYLKIDKPKKGTPERQYTYDYELSVIYNEAVLPYESSVSSSNNQ